MTCFDIKHVSYLLVRNNIKFEDPIIVPEHLWGGTLTDLRVIYPLPPKFELQLVEWMSTWLPLIISI